ncbi:MAG TPA: glutathione S-transferase family protein [Parvularculaceae bacterium]|nr:glutathione S-transferase family protein [Parvularculaceae bacterium]
MSEKPVLYHMPQTRGGTTLWMNEELGGVCETKLVNLRKGEGRSPEFLKINPMGKLPALVHKGVAVTEAAAICAYLADLYPEKGLAPATNDPKRGAYYRWMFFAPSCIEPMMLDRLGKVTRENATAAGHGDYERVMASINQALSTGPWLLGEKFSAADVVMGSTLFFATMFGAIPKEGRVKDYVERVAARPAHQAMVKKNAELSKEMGL